MTRPSEAQVIAGAKALHQAWEMHYQLQNPFFSRTPWDEIGDESRQEFIGYVRPALEAAWEAQ